MSEEILNQSETIQSEPTLKVTETMKVDLLSAAKWTKFLCVVGCVGVGLMLIAAVCMMFFGALASKMLDTMMPLGPLMGVVYIIMAALYIYPILKGFQFANGAKAACLQNDQYQLARGFAGLNSLLRFMGILTIIVISIYAIILVFAILFAAVGIAAMQ